MTEGSRTEELEEGKMIGNGAVINHEYPEGNIVDYNNYKDSRMNIYIPGLSGKNEDTSLFDEDHYFWGMKNVVNLSHEETINNLNRLIDNLDKWLVPTPPTQNTDMVEPLMDTETDDPNDDELNTKDNMDMERNEMDTKTDDPNDGELNNTTHKAEINPEHYMCKELPINILVVENLLDNNNDDRSGTAANHHTDADRRQKKRGNIFRRFWSYIRKNECCLSRTCAT